MHAIAIVRYGVQEVKQDLRVSTHRAGDVAQRDKRRWSRDLAFAGDGQDFAALAETLPDGATQVRYRSKRIRTQSARSAKIEGQNETADLAFGFGDFVGAHRLEVHLLEAFAIRHGEHRIDHR